MTDATERNMAVFNHNYMATMQRYADLEQTIKELEETKKEVRKELKSAMEFYNVRTIDNDIVRITVVPPTESVTINTKALRIDRPEVYEELIEAYPKRTSKDSYLRVTIK